MKKIILAAAIVFLLTSFGKLMAWDTTAAKYLPLQVGNVWVYDCTTTGYLYYTRYYAMYKITGTVDTTGVTYYVFQVRRVMISGSEYYSCIGFSNLNSKLRIDSATMNIYKPGYCPGRSEVLLDSLKARVHDTVITCRESQYFNGSSACTDTTPYYIFNTNVSSKRFGEAVTHEAGAFTIYAKDIGIASWDFAYQMNQCHDRLKGCVINGVLRGDTSMIVGLQNIGTEVPKEFSLYQNYPNPFNPVTKMKFSLPAPFKGGVWTVGLIIYDLLGREVASLIPPLRGGQEGLQPGTYEIEWDATNFPSGVYFYKLTAGDYSESKKMILLK